MLWSNSMEPQRSRITKEIYKKTNKARSMVLLLFKDMNCSDPGGIVTALHRTRPGE